MCRLPGQERWKLIGIINQRYGCGRAGQPDVFTRVDSFVSWIQNNLNQAEYFLFSNSKCQLYYFYDSKFYGYQLLIFVFENVK